MKYRAKRLEEVGLVTEQTHSGQPGQEMARLRKAEDSEPVKMFRPLLPKNWEARLE